MKIVPEDTIAEILSYLPVKSVLRFKLVSKRWRSVIKTEYFTKLHLRKSLHNRSTKLCLILQPCQESNSFANERILSITVDSRCQSVKLRAPFNYRIRILGSCNGLLLIKESEHSFMSVRDRILSKIALWNPSTDEVCSLRTLKAEEFETNSNKHYLEVAYAFGHDSVSDDYKVLVHLNVESIDPSKLKVRVFSLKTNSWRSIAAPSYFSYIFDISCTQTPYVLVRDAFHWLSRYLNPSIVAFDLNKEEFFTMPLPNLEVQREYNLGVMRECLSLATSYFNNHIYTIDIWMMKEYGIKESWFKLYSFGTPRILGYITYLPHLVYPKHNDDKFLVTTVRHSCTNLIWYDLKTKTQKLVRNRDAKYLTPAYNFVPSLVSPKVVKIKKLHCQECEKLRNNKRKRC